MLTLRHWLEERAPWTAVSLCCDAAELEEVTSGASAEGVLQGCELA